ncbi:hypothetical protein SYNPS1DRAFT_26253 [Syncephalis pseudoplumigaleata]|uniref:SRA1/Sec31 domain-containing protein n=1 Tax=Syncephalis pseudoplumigaleata TaxID=1712513 RepID=A0A4P9Z6A2_9FUNG|nr:hypothetical protein SYNPS1DRAFT_26253 [Syncephalis pseudoplumigaleata]|eukprot:RKP28167.1 hypothetical protein SYNPS1DRAFT_26253 [Syncephalis pseudoplumigaleata]
MAGDLATINPSSKPSIAPPMPVTGDIAAGRPSLPPPPPPPANSANPAHRPPPPPPPPQHGTAPGVPYAYSKTGNYRDFRDQGHAEDGHWNDVPTAVLTSARKRQGTLPSSSSPSSGEGEDRGEEGGATVDASLDSDQLVAGIEAILSECTAASAALTPVLKRMLTDTERRMQELLTRLKSGQIAVHVQSALSRFLQAIKNGDYATATQIHVDLVQTDFDSEGRWLVGAKRLVEIVQATRKSN